MKVYLKALAFEAQTSVGPTPARATGSRWKSALLPGCLMVAFVFAGCKSTSPSQYVSPRIEGRLLDAQTHQPVHGVNVRQPLPDQNPAVVEAPKGATVLNQPRGVLSGKDGRFVMDSERDLALFRTFGWYSVSISFEHPAYKPLTATYTLSDATNTAAGEPVVKAGDILLTPRAK
jgi:hypothetical protein